MFKRFDVDGAVVVMRPYNGICYNNVTVFFSVFLVFYFFFVFFDEDYKTKVHTHTHIRLHKNDSVYRNFQEPLTNENKHIDRFVIFIS